jgi:hypothetical protein
MGCAAVQFVSFSVSGFVMVKIVRLACLECVMVKIVSFNIA